MAASESNDAPRGRAKLRDVAIASGVSASVASRVLNNDPTLYLRNEKRDRVVAAALKLNYRPNAAGRSLRTQSTGAIAVLVPRLTNPFFAPIISGVEDECDVAGIVPMFGRAERLTPGSGILARLVGEGRVDGFILQISDEMTNDMVDQILQSSVPRVLIQSHTAGHQGSVVLDVEGGTRLAVEHLISLGHRDIGFAGGLPHHDTAVARESAFRAALAKAGIPVNEDWTTRFGFHFENGQTAFDSIWALPRQPTAIVAANVNIGLGILGGAAHAGVDVPNQLSVAALHDSDLAAKSYPRLTTVRMPLYELGRTAVSHLLELLAGGEPREILVDSPAPELIIRASTRRVGETGGDGSRTPTPHPNQTDGKD